MLAVLRVRDDAYGVPIARAIEQHTGPDRHARRGRTSRSTGSPGRGSSRARLGDPTPERGGRAKKFFTRHVRAASNAVRRTQRAFIALWTGIPELKGARSMRTPPALATALLQRLGLRRSTRSSATSPKSSAPAAHASVGEQVPRPGRSSCASRRRRCRPVRTAVAQAGRSLGRRWPADCGCGLRCADAGIDSPPTPRARGGRFRSSRTCVVLRLRALGLTLATARPSSATWVRFGWRTRPHARRRPCSRLLGGRSAFEHLEPEA